MTLRSSKFPCPERRTVIKQHLSANWWHKPRINVLTVSTRGPDTEESLYLYTKHIFILYQKLSSSRLSAYFFIEPAVLVTM